MSWVSVIDRSNTRFTCIPTGLPIWNIRYVDVVVGQFNRDKYEIELYITELGVEPVLQLIEMLNLKPFTYAIEFKVETTDFHDDLWPQLISGCHLYSGRPIYCLYHECDCSTRSFMDLDDIGDMGVVNVRYLIFNSHANYSLGDYLYSVYSVRNGFEVVRDGYPSLLDRCKQIKRGVSVKRTAHYDNNVV